MAAMNEWLGFIEIIVLIEVASAALAVVAATAVALCNLTPRARRTKGDGATRRPRLRL
jgi:hypothetical protein